jgi:hypothetical protein
MHDAIDPLAFATPVDEEAAVLEGAFIAGFRTAADKQAFLALCRVPTSVPTPNGGPSLKLVEVRIEDVVVVGAVSPGFGARELVHQPLPGRLTRQASRLSFEYVSVDERRSVTLGELHALG